MKSRLTLTLVLAVMGALVVGAVVAYFWWTRRPPLVRNLPDEAEDVHWKDLDMFPDWGFLMSAKLAERPCRAFVREELADLEPFDPVALDGVGERSVFASWIPLDPEADGDVSWWDPAPLSEDATWIQHYSDGGIWTIAQCANGRLYFQESSN